MYLLRSRQETRSPLPRLVRRDRRLGGRQHLPSPSLADRGSSAPRVLFERLVELRQDLELPLLS